MTLNELLARYSAPDDDRAIEEMAKAIFYESGPLTGHKPAIWEDVSDSLRNKYRQVSRAALAVIVWLRVEEQRLGFLRAIADLERMNQQRQVGMLPAVAEKWERD